MIDQIHSINATHLIDSEIYRVYADARGNIYELAIEKLANRVDALLAYYYHHRESMGTKSQKNVAILSPDGLFFAVNAPHERVIIDQDIFYMFLNPIQNINGWQYQAQLSKNTIPDDFLKKTYPKTAGPHNVYNLLFEARKKVFSHIYNL